MSINANNDRLKSYIFSNDKHTCTGCGTCVLSCPRKALKMQDDSEGFLFPSVDRSKCVRCGICDTVCPTTGCDMANAKQPQHCYVATSTKKQYYKQSATIGICTMLAEIILRKGGVVYGAYLDEISWTAYHIVIRNYDEIEKIRNSKYLQSDTVQTYLDAQEQLVSGVTVLYIGTPCQIAGLKSYLRCDYPNLYTVDLICHGVFSPKLMSLEIAYWKKQYGGGR